MHSTTSKYYFWALAKHSLLFLCRKAEWNEWKCTNSPMTSSNEINRGKSDSATTRQSNATKEYVKCVCIWRCENRAQEFAFAMQVNELKGQMDGKNRERNGKNNTNCVLNGPGEGISIALVMTPATMLWWWRDSSRTLVFILSTRVKFMRAVSIVSISVSFFGSKVDSSSC